MKPSISTSSWLSVCSRSSWPPPRPAAALAADGVDLVDEDDGGGILFGLRRRGRARGSRPRRRTSPQSRSRRWRRTARPASPATALGEQRLAGARRAHEQHALGDVRAEAADSCSGISQELHDLLQLLLLLVRARDVAERSLFVTLAGRLDAGLAEAGHLAVHPAARVAGHEVHQQDERQNRQHIRQQQLPAGLSSGRRGSYSR